MFASRKMDFTDLMAAICLVVNASKGLSAVQLSRDLDVQYKTAWVLAHKIREAISAEVKDMTLTGEVEMDGAYFKPKVRKPNVRAHQKDRKDGRSIQHEGERVVIAIRQRQGRTLTFVRKREAEGVDIAKRVVSPNSILFTDEGRHWSRLDRHFDHREVNHSLMYSDHGKNTNGAESYFSRLRRMVIGQHHGVSAKYLHQYAAHCAWLEDHRRRDNGTNARAIVADAMKHPVSRNWKGYWQRRAA
jgi:transposase-like protein